MKDPADKKSRIPSFPFLDTRRKKAISIFMSAYPPKENEKMLDLGGYTGQNAGFIAANIDEPCDVKCDLEKIPYPFPDNYADRVVLTSVLQHIRNPLDAMQEIWRICKPNAKVYITVPYWKFHTVLYNPYHHNDFMSEWFKNLGHRIINRDDRALVKCNFKFLREWYLRGRLRFWKKYHTFIVLEAVK